MLDQTKIEWCDYTVNAWEGCQKVGKKAAGRFLDGREWNQFPEEIR
ncbi:hypothetical protein QEZ52_00495 [Aliisedimentitalea scapharcae]|uniref:Uncharacterized protein n=1 Tax=Aliisedimentitalea scapharcae TaxID=1524259 RepID=A0ABZ2XSJ8_9RHOB